MATISWSLIVNVRIRYISHTIGSYGSSPIRGPIHKSPTEEPRGAVASSEGGFTWRNARFCGYRPRPQVDDRRSFPSKKHNTKLMGGFPTPKKMVQIHRTIGGKKSFCVPTLCYVSSCLLCRCILFRVIHVNVQVHHSVYPQGWCWFWEERLPCSVFQSNARICSNWLIYIIYISQMLHVWNFI